VSLAQNFSQLSQNSFPVCGERPRSEEQERVG
jgi:hypothetical protein